MAAVPPGEVVSPLTIRLFGPFEVCINGHPLPRLRYRKTQSVLALLALRHGAEVERDWLAGLLLPESAGSQALRNCLTELRRALAPHACRLHAPSHHTLRLDLSGVSVDVLAFDAAIARGDAASLEHAAALYRGPLLEGCAEEWVFQERQTREQAYLAARETLAAQALARGDPADAQRHLRSVITTDPLRESAQRSLMELFAAGGNYAAALLAYRELRQRLHRELNAEPDPETQTLFQRLRAEAREKASAGLPSTLAGSSPPPGFPAAAGNGKDPHARLASEAPFTTCLNSNGDGDSHLFAQASKARRNGTPLPHYLPLQLTSFIGRQAEMAEIRQQLGAQRLVTLTGAGGCGKTRLAIEVATGLLAAFPAGVWLVQLAPLADSALVPQTVAAALGILEQPDRPVMQTLVDALKPQQSLLVFDNCEHLVAACAELAEMLLQACPQLRILATSREPLGIAGEQPYRVPSLSLPSSVDGRWLMVDEPAERGSSLPTTINPQPSTLLQSEAVRLFVERAAMAQPAFALSVENAPTVAQVCCRLDGIPLALELAAARLNALPLETLRERLDDMFGLLTGGSRTALPRHQTLRALIDWSYDLLTPPEQTLLRRLSVFAGGCTLEAVEAICSYCGLRIADCGLGTSGSSPELSWAEQDQHPGSNPIRNPQSAIRNEPVLDLLTRLVEKSLVIYEEREGEGRYRLLEMIREYAWEQLVGSGEVDGPRERHARFLLALARTAEPGLAGPDQGLWLDRLEREHDNLRAALAWAMESGEIDLGLRLGSALERFWCPRGYLKEGRAQLLRLLAHPGAAAPTAARARGLSAAGVLTSLQGDLEPARELLEESLAIWRHLEDRAGIATALQHLGWLVLQQWDQITARALVEESLAIRRELREPRGIADALTLLAEVFRLERNLPAGRALVEESLALWRKLDDRGRIVRGLDSLGDAALLQGDVDTARAAYEEGLATARELGDRLGIASALHGLGNVAHWHEDWPAARTFYEQSLPLWRELDHKHGLLHILCQLVVTLREQGDSPAAYYALCQEMLAISREGNWSNHVARSLVGLGAAAADLGRWEEAAAHCAASLRLSRSGESAWDRLNIAWGLTGLARAALAAGRPAWAARLLGATERLWALALVPFWRRELDRAASATRAQLEPAEFEATWAAGQAMPLEQIIDEALQEAPAG